jgi:hypothetical protein
MTPVTAIATLLAQESTHKTLWNPTLLGILVVLSAIGLFCGSVYLLLATNLGARLGFLVAAACLTGFLSLLSVLWITTFTPLESPKGREPSWQLKEIVSDLGQAKSGTVRNIATGGKPVNTSDLANIRPAIDGALVIPSNPLPGAAPPGPLAKYHASTDYITGEEGLQAFVVGGGTKNAFWHYPKYAAVQFCQTELVNVPFGEKPPAPRCDPLQPRQWAILERDLGSLRQPPFFFFIAFIILFGLSLRGLHWYELDQRERRAKGLATLPTT